MGFHREGNINLEKKYYISLYMVTVNGKLRYDNLDS